MGWEDGGPCPGCNASGTGGRATVDDELLEGGVGCSLARAKESERGKEFEEETEDCDLDLDLESDLKGLVALEFESEDVRERFGGLLERLDDEAEGLRWKPDDVENELEWTEEVEGLGVF